MLDIYLIYMQIGLASKLRYYCSEYYYKSSEYSWGYIKYYSRPVYYYSDYISNFKANMSTSWMN